MAYIEISNLPETLNLNDESVFPVVYQGETRKVKFNSMAKIFNYFTSISYNKTTGVYTFTRVDGTSALLSTDLQKSFKDVSLSNGIITFTAHSGETKTIDISIPDNSITFAKLAVALQTRIDSKYSKPGSGIPKADLSNEVQASLEKAETAIQDVSGKEDKSNKVTTLSSSSTDTQYPSAKTVYDNFVTRDEEIEKLQTENAQLLADHPDILDENNEFPSGTDLTLNGTGDLKMKVDVGGNSTQIQYEGYNLLPYTENFTETKNGVTFEGNKGIYKISGNPSNSNFSNDISLLENYTIQENDYLHYGNNKLNANISVRIIFSDNTNDTTGMSTINRIFSLANYVGKTITKIGFYNSANYSGEEIIIKPMILNNVSTVTDFEPYVGGQTSPNPNYKQDINNVEGDVVVKGSSKNLLNINNIPNTTYQTVSNDTLIISGENYSSTRKKLSELAPSLQIGKTYCLNFESTAQDHNTVIYLSGENNTWTKNTLKTITQVMLDSIVVFYGGDTMGAIISNIQLEEGTTSTPYVPHAENTVTFPLAEGQKLMLGDTLEDDGIHHKRGQYVFTGDETIGKSGYSNEDYFCGYYNIIGEKIVLGRILCNILGYAQYNVFPIKEGIWAQTNQSINFSIKASRLTENSVEGVKAYLTQLYNNGTPMVVEYKLADSALEDNIDPYTPEQQTAYNKLKEMQSYYDLTYVVGSSNNAQPILTAHAKKSIKTIGSEDLTDYVKNTDYATSSTGGVIKTASASATDISSGVLQASTKTYSDYTSGQNTMFIGKGTLENVITGKGLTNVAHTNSNNNFSTAQTINGTLTVVGDISQTGTTYETHAEQLYTAKDIIKTRDGAVGGLGNNEVTGIEAIKYDGTNNGRLIFDNTGTAKVGDVGDEVPLLARDESTNMTNNYVMTWDSTNLIAKTSFGVVTLTQAQYDALVSGGTVDSNTFYYTTEDILE